MPQYSKLVDEACKTAKTQSSCIDEQIRIASDLTFVMFGMEILKIIPGRVSTEVDAR